MTEKRAAKPARKPRAAKGARHEVLRVRLVRSKNSTPIDQKATVRALGFRRVGEIVEMDDNPSARGRIRKVRHLIEILEGDRVRAEN